ncbi:MAG: single-stranded-DNA-specific exonuclease RecJ [Chloroflexi bacterium]|nr:single-stranded-DNA-specific exonuclease RecJ [Chloroflexota bacterium]
MRAATGERRLVRGSGGRLWRLPGTVDLSPLHGAPWPRLLSRLLLQRGVRSLEQARALIDTPAAPGRPADLPQIDRAVARLASACEGAEHVAVFGDYDVDGLTSTAILVETLSALGARPLAYLPHRTREGYGPNAAAIQELARRGASLLVTADCGTSAVDEVAQAHALGMETVILDHHAIPRELPPAIAIVNPRLDSATEGTEPAACGIAYAVAHRLHEKLGAPYDPDPHQALAALGTICDLAPLVGANRDLVRSGLAALGRSRRPGLHALAEIAGSSLQESTADLCGWVLGPRLNAAGRMEHPQLALDLLLAPGPAEAEPLARRLEELNARRRSETQEAREHLAALLDEEERAAPLLIAASPAIAAGLAGPLASRLVDDHGRPAIVIHLSDGAGRASCRSIPGFDITELLGRHGDLFLSYGGHRAAAGFSIDERRLPELRRRLIADAADRLDPEMLTPTIEVDAALPLHDVTPQLLGWLDRLAPHGTGNPIPTFVAPKVRVASARSIGRDGSHLRFTARSGGASWRAIAFGKAEHEVPPGTPADLVYRFRADRRSGELELDVLDLRPSRVGHPPPARET